jgi:choice-of-anchor C domain-containing protein
VGASILILFILGVIMNIRSALAISLAVLGIALSTNAGAATLVLDGDFSNPWGGNFTTYGVGAMGPSWNVTSGSVDLIGSYWQAPSAGGGSVDLAGNGPGGISQSLLLNPGSYKLTFSLSGNPDNGTPLKGVRTSIGGVTQDFFYSTGANTHADMKYDLESIVFAISGVGQQSALLSFLSLDSDTSWGAVIGNVSVSAIPLPAALPLFGAALLGAFGFSRRRRAE